MNKSVKWTGVNTRDPLPLRAKPDSKATQLAAIPKGAKVSVCDTSKGWHYVKHDGVYGYVSANYVEAKHTTFSKTEKWLGKTQGACYMRTWAHPSAEAVCSVPKGSTVSVMDTRDGYYYAKYSGKVGFLPQGKVKYTTDKITPTTFLASVKKVQEMARAKGWIYADSQSNVPCADGKISCDRLVARALWDMGYHDQCKGGIALGRNFEAYLMQHGFKRSTNMADAKAGSVMVVMNPSKSSRHVFVIASRSGDRFTRYDCGSTDWIRSKQPLQGLWMAYVIGIYNM